MEQIEELGTGVVGKRSKRRKCCRERKRCGKRAWSLVNGQENKSVNEEKIKGGKQYEEEARYN